MCRKYKEVEWAQIHPFGHWNPLPLLTSWIILGRSVTSNKHLSSWGFYYLLPLGVTYTAWEKISSWWLFPLSRGWFGRISVLPPCCGVQNSSSWSLGIRKLGGTLRNPALPKVRATHSLWEGASHQCSRGWGGAEERGWDAFVMPLASFTKIRWPGWFWPGGEVFFCSASLSTWLGTIETGVDGMGQNENQSADVQGPG